MTTGQEVDPHPAQAHTEASKTRRLIGKTPKPATQIMPLDPRLEQLPGALPLHTELSRLVRAARSVIDFYFYNVGTGIALASSGAATVMAAANELIIAAILSAVATFFVAITKILQFGSRWAWSIERESRYSALIYELNGAALEPSEEDQLKIVADIYAKMKEERLRDKLLPGISDSVA